MSRSIRFLSALLISALTFLGSAFPAQASGSTELWTTTSKSSFVGLSLPPKVAIKGNVGAVAWVQRTGIASSKLMVRVMRTGVWGSSDTLVTNTSDWWDAFDVQVSASGKVYVAYQTPDVTLTVFTSSEANVWTNAVVDDSSSNLGATEVSGTTTGGLVAFTSSRADSNRSATLSSYVFDESNSGAGWTTTAVHTFTASDFSSCTIKHNYYDSCAVDVNESQFAIAADGSEVLFTNVGRNSANGLPPTNQFKLFKFHRGDSLSDWISDGAVNTLTLGSKDNGYSFFLGDLATTSTGKYAIALTTGGSSANTLRIFTGATFASAPVASDTTYIASLKSTDAASIVALNNDFYVAFDAQSKHKFGKVGSLSTTTTAMSQASSDQEVSNLLVVGGNIVAVIITPKGATYLTTRTTIWSAKTKVLSYGGASSPNNGPAVTDGSYLLLAAPRFNGNRMTGLYSYNN